MLKYLERFPRKIEKFVKIFEKIGRFKSSKSKSEIGSFKDSLVLA